MNPLNFEKEIIINKNKSREEIKSDIDIDWIPEYIQKVKDYLYVRKEDDILILRPMMVHHLNKVGTLILSKFLAGASNQEVITALEAQFELPQNQIKHDIFDFISDIRAIVSGCPIYLEHDSVESIPYKSKNLFYPILSELALTYRCNNECIFCYSNSSPAKQCQELSQKQIEQIIRIIKENAKVPSISFTGGEPTIIDQLPRYIYVAREYGMRVNLITNGRRCKNTEFSSELVKQGLHSAQVSIEGSNPQIHDAITRRPGSFNDTVKGILNLKSLGINVHTNTTINRMNLYDLTKLVDLIVDKLHNDYFSMNMVIYTGSSLNDLKKLMVRYSEIGEYVKAVHYYAKERGIKFIWYSPTCYKYFHPASLTLDFKSCAACHGLLSVNPQGDVIPCSSFQGNIGNLLKEDFKKIWSNKSAIYWRSKNYARPICRKCEYFSTCEGACPLYWDIIGLDELSKACNTRISPFQKLKYYLKRRILAPQSAFKPQKTKA